MSIEGQIREIVKEEMGPPLEEVEGRLNLMGKEIEEMMARLSNIEARAERIEEKLGDKFNVLMRLRKRTLNHLMSEYSKVEEAMRPEGIEPKETAEA